MSIILGLTFLLASAIALNVPLCGTPDIPTLRFSFYNGTADSSNSTKAELCHDGSNLLINWDNTDSEVISPYEHCNDPLYNADAVQIFIATESSYPYKYFELEVSPKSQLFFADITNPTGYCSKLGTSYQDCGLAQYKAKITPTGWQATLKIKLDIIGRGVPLKQFKVNLFRIDVSSKAPTKYLTWQPTMTPVPCFHVPAVFQVITLV